MEKLKKEIKENQKTISTTEYRMSIGELIHLYKDEEIVINSEFQRLFRWSQHQKSRLIESILIGIPVPSIFFQQRENGIWEVIDGLQRISTILEFVGELKSNNINNQNESIKDGLLRTTLLPSLGGVTYKELDKEIQLVFKRYAINLVILKRESDQDTKYELFDRLNSGGSSLTDQEIRQAIYRHTKRSVLEMIENLAENNQEFKDLINLSDIKQNLAYDRELVLRFFAYKNASEKFQEYGNNVKPFLDKYLLEDLDNRCVNDYRKEFESFFQFLNSLNNEKVFSLTKGFSIAKYEAIIIGLANSTENLKKDNETRTAISKKIDEISTQPWFGSITSGSSNASKRLKGFLENDNVKDYFADNSA